MTTHPPQAIIVGAGPVGLTTALALARQDIPVVVLEAEPALTHDLRAASYHPPTLEMLASLGIGQTMHERGYIVQRWQYRDRREGLIVEWDLGVLAEDTEYPWRLHLEQHQLTRILADALAAYPHAQVLFSHRVTAIEQMTDHAIARCQCVDGERLVSGAWLIGADGGSGVVRKSLDTEFEGFTWPERNVNISTPYDIGQHGYTFNCYIADPAEWAGLFKVPHLGPPGLWRIGFPVPDDETDEQALSDEGTQARLTRLLPWEREYPVAYRSIYRVHQRVARDWRRGRVILAGDAAHLNNPVGAMGLNGGVHDAINLADKLGRVWRGEADVSALDLYVRQRRTANIEFIQAGSIRNKRTLEERDPAVREQRHAEMRALADDPVRTRAFLLGTSMIESVRRAATIT